jgi:hypothetical protein
VGERNFTLLVGKKRITYLESSQVLPARPSDKISMKMKRLEG